MSNIGEYNSLNYLINGYLNHKVPEYIGLRPDQVETANKTYNLLKNNSKKDILAFRKEHVQIKENWLDVIKYVFGLDDRRANKRATDRLLNELDGKVLTTNYDSNLEGITNDSLGMFGSSML